MFRYSDIEFSNIDKKRGIKLPKKLSPKLAYLIGVHIGDGTMGYYKNKNDYWISYSGHLIDEYNWYINTLKPLIKFLFNIDSKIQKDRRIGRNSVRLYLRSKAILTFLNRVGLPLGPKKDLKVPLIIKKSNKKIKKNFLLGLADTEFCLTFKRRNKRNHYYPVIEYSTADRKLMYSVINLLNEFDIKGYNLKMYPTKRNGKKLFINQFHLNGEANLNKWLKNIGFKSEKHLTKLEIWRKYGFCPARTNLIDRRKILDRSIDINSFM
ncbi:MAG: LAGLIDADG family homing endonuclease [Nanoarchaeota archaeon]